MASLDKSECRLLQDDALVDTFNTVDSVLSSAKAALPRFAKREAVAKIESDLSQIAAAMVRRRFTIGFIGPSQAGKSTTVGNLLAVSKDESPAPQGTGGPTTSVPTRLIPCDYPSPHCPEGERHLIELQFMTQKEFCERVRDLCQIVKLEYDDNRGRLLKAAERHHEEYPHLMAADHRVLTTLLKAAEQFPEVLQQTALVESGVYSRRRDYATHQDKPSRYTLLSEVRIHFVTDAMSLDLEMIDLPGLGVDKESDETLTLRFLPQLDGAFMFQLASQVKGAEISKLARTMRQQHRESLGGRVWMVITRCDDLNELQIDGPPDDASQPSMFDHLNETLTNQGLSEDAVIFVGNEYHKTLLSAREAGAEPESVRGRFPTVLRFDESGRPIVPERCQRYPGQVEAWKRFVVEAGMPHLRETMQRDVAESVRRQARSDISQKLSRLIHALIDELHTAEQQSAMSVEDMRHAATWSGKLSIIAEELKSRPAVVDSLLVAVTGNMVRLLDDWGMPSPGQLAEGHSHLAKTLARSAVEEASALTRGAVEGIKSLIETQMRDSPCPNAPGLPSPLEYWEQQADTFLFRGKTCEIRGGREFSRDFREASFGMLASDSSPFASDADAALSVTDYTHIMREKVRRVTHVYGSRLVAEMCNHLTRLAERYRSVGADAENVDVDRSAKYLEYRTRLMALR
jgi:hypothetical protein